MCILRVDDRLIHGQVVAGWARPLGINLLVLVSDRISSDEWTCNAYRLAIPKEIEFICVTINKSVAIINSKNNKNIMIIVESVCEAYAILKKGLKIKEVFIGGLSYKKGAREIAPYIYLSAEDIDAVVKLFNMGVTVIGKQLPNSSAIDVVKTLAGVK